MAEAPCTIEGCSKRTHARGLCRSHYHQARKPENERRRRQALLAGASKKCKKCGVLKPVTEYPPSSRLSRDGFLNVCRKCCWLHYERRYHLANRERKLVENRRAHVKRFGLTDAEYLELLARQHFVCAICHRPESAAIAPGRTRALAIDHDHETGDVRGLLCSKCNTALGQADDSPERLLAMAIYLERSRGRATTAACDGQTTRQ